jgi:hypothetical protein
MPHQTKKLLTGKKSRVQRAIDKLALTGAISMAPASTTRRHHHHQHVVNTLMNQLQESTTTSAVAVAAAASSTTDIFAPLETVTVATTGPARRAVTPFHSYTTMFPLDTFYLQFKHDAGIRRKLFDAYYIGSDQSLSGVECAREFDKFGYRRVHFSHTDPNHVHVNPFQPMSELVIQHADLLSAPKYASSLKVFSSTSERVVIGMLFVDIEIGGARGMYFIDNLRAGLFAKIASPSPSFETDAFDPTQLDLRQGMVCTIDHFPTMGVKRGRIFWTTECIACIDED